MFDIGWQELFILAVLFIIVIGPKDMPGAVRTISKWIRKARSMARDLQDGLDEVVREAELDDLKNEIQSAGGLDLAKKIGDAVDPTGEIAADMDLDKDVYDEMSGALEDLKESTAPDDPDSPKGTDDEASAKALPETPSDDPDAPKGTDDEASAKAPSETPSAESPAKSGDLEKAEAGAPKTARKASG